MNQQGQIDWEQIRQRGDLFPAEALDFVRDGLAHTAERRGVRRPPSPPSRPQAVPAAPLHGRAGGRGEPACDLTGRELCEGLRDLAIQRYGLLARTVLRKWGILRTDDFGAIVYALIDRGDLHAGPNDSIDDFRAVYEFDEAFPEGG